jgi:ABC-type spermidine/putrescine transport system permease subunit II
VASDRGGAWHPRWFWPAFAAPGMVWLVVLFLLPFYVVLSIAFGVNLLESDGMVNRLLVSAGLLGEPFPWLAGQPVTVTLGLVYGYIPYMVLALYAGLDRVDQRLLEAARDLGPAAAGPSCWSPCPCPARPSWPGWS